MLPKSSDREGALSRQLPENLAIYMDEIACLSRRIVPKSGEEFSLSEKKNLFYVVVFTGKNTK